MKPEEEQKLDRRGRDSKFPNAAISKRFYTLEKEGKWLGGMRNIKKKVTHLCEAIEGPLRCEGEQKVGGEGQTQNFRMLRIPNRSTDRSAFSHTCGCKDRGF